MDYEIRKLADYLLELPQTGVHVPALICATEKMLAQIVGDTRCNKQHT
jgi:hypothetical protein